jgi:alpha-amylase/alpha-mannosidase (GH57 family)
MTRVAILWHMHQPFYEDLLTGEHLLPWVRLHALKDYYGMVALTREFPDVRMTFNLVPSLLVQLEAFAAGRAQDRDLELTLKPAEALDEREIEFILETFFHAQQQRMIDVYPRYRELLARRGGSMPTAADRRHVAAQFSRDDLRDLQLWHKLAWLDPFYLEGDVRVRRLIAKGRDFTEEDKYVLREVELELLNKVIPEYRDAQARGQVELSTSPFFHPILPLLCDTDIYLRTHPNAHRPRRPFVHPEDAVEQLTRAVRYHTDLFGTSPTGVWPSEGAVSDAIVPLVAAAGFQWMATDEQILAKSLGISLIRDGRGQLEQPGRLYAPYRVRSGGASIACAFRDHVLSDLIGFTYAGWSPETAAEDFVGRIAEAGRLYAQRTGGEDATIFIILDGENAWEHFEGGGRPFLRALYGRLSTHAEIRTATMAEACRNPRLELAGIFPGSWIDANFYIWIGHADDQRGWSQLAEARTALDQASVDPDTAAAAREEIFIAEGSDWFWWYGDDHSSAHDLEFDDLFRRHLRNAYRLLQQPVPDELFASNVSTHEVAPPQTDPQRLLTPTLDGEDTSYFEWLGAGLSLVRDVAGAMHRSDGPAALLTAVRFGFDRDRLFVRIDAREPLVDLLAGGCEVSLKFLQPAGVRFSVSATLGRLRGAFWDRPASEPRWTERRTTEAAVAAGAILELALPWSELGAAAGDRVAFFVAIYEGDAERERHPAQQPIAVTMPDGTFEARQWTA